MSKTESSSGPSVQQVLDDSGKNNKTSILYWFIMAIFSAIAILVVFKFWGMNESVSQQSYELVELKNGDLQLSVTATGNLQPLNQVDIGTELSGTVQFVHVENNDRVQKGQQLARLNRAQWQDTLNRRQAELASAKAKVNLATVSVKESRINLKRLQELHQSSGGALPAQTDLDTADAALQRAQAEDMIAQADVLSAEAELHSAKTILDKAIIVSPINGVVLNRAVEPGQTVAASLSAPTLFTLAEDLSRMELEVGVDEADVGQVKMGQSAEFTVDAWPGRQYPAKITRVSLGSSSSENVVSYIAVLALENADLSLRPGMTATATIKTQSRDNVRLIPNAALRFIPEQTVNTEMPQQAPSNAGGLLSKLMPGPPGMPSKQKRKSSDRSSLEGGMKQVWVLENGTPVPKGVRVGISDGKFTELLDGELQLGMQVIVGSGH